MVRQTWLGVQHGLLILLALVGLQPEHMWPLPQKTRVCSQGLQFREQEDNQVPIHDTVHTSECFTLTLALAGQSKSYYQGQSQAKRLLIKGSRCTKGEPGGFLQTTEPTEKHIMVFLVKHESSCLGFRGQLV